MFTKLIRLNELSLYETLLKILFWIVPLVSSIFGWLFAHALLFWRYGLVSPLEAGLIGASAGFIGGLILSVIFFGTLLVLNDIRKAVRALEPKHNL